MVKRCVVYGCKNSPAEGITLHEFPKEVNRCKQWVRFVQRTRKWESKPHTSHICSKHFSKEAIANYFQVEMGITKRFILTEDAVPTIYPSTEPESNTASIRHVSNDTAASCSASASKVNSRKAFRKREVARLLADSEETHDCATWGAPINFINEEQVPVAPEPKSKDASCQADLFIAPKETRTIGTQTSFKNHRRSKGIQVKVKSKDASVQALRKSSTPVTSTPKKHRLEESFEMSEVESELESSYVALESKIEYDEPAISPSNQRKLLVFEEQLLSLFYYCCVCSQCCIVESMYIGTLVAVKQKCQHCHFQREWHSQPFVNGIPAGNLLLSAAIYFNGASFTKMNKVLNAIQIQGVSLRTHYSHMRNYLQPAIYHFWKSKQREMLQSYRDSGGQLTLGGDMRADSPGHCAKYGSYTMMELDGKNIVDIQLIQSNEVGGSCYMEKEGLIRSVTLLEKAGLAIGSLVTDRHPQIQKYVREEMIQTIHYFDVWHVAKGLRKKMEALGREKDCQDINDWIKSISNHLYWCAASSTSSNEILAKWKSVVNHIQNIHVHENPLFPVCLHDASLRRRYLKPSTKSCEKLTSILMNKRLLGDIAKLSPLQQTSSIEAFHSLILQFAPKNLNYSYKGMLCRLLLAAIHYNENTDRPQAHNSKGQPIFRIRFPKYKKGGFTVTPAKPSPTYGYINSLLDLLCDKVVSNPGPYQQLINEIEIPDNLCDAYERPSFSEAINNITSRFRKE